MTSLPRAHKILSPLPVATLLAMALPPNVAAGATTNEMLLQTPELQPPERGVISGSLAHTELDPGDLARGRIRVPLPATVPTARGPALVNPFPSYTVDGGISEWGLGWQTQLRIERSAVVGDIDFQGDEFTSPWGRLARGSDGSYYPRGLRAAVRLERDGEGTLPYLGVRVGSLREVHARTHPAERRSRRRRGTGGVEDGTGMGL